MTWLVESHVEAKRYLTYRDPDYYATLSDATKETLKYQGEPMSAAEARTLEQDELFDLIIKMRYWDDEAIIQDRPVSDTSQYRQMGLRYLTQGTQQTLISYR